MNPAPTGRKDTIVVKAKLGTDVAGEALPGTMAGNGAWVAASDATTAKSDEFRVKQATPNIEGLTRSTHGSRFGHR